MAVSGILPAKGQIRKFLDALDEYDSPSVHEVVVSIVIQFAKRKLIAFLAKSKPSVCYSHRANRKCS